MQTINQPTLFVGGGTMAHAIISGSLNIGVLNQSRVGVIEPDTTRHTLFEHAFSEPSGAMDWFQSQSSHAGTIVLAVKPQMLEPACAPLVGLLEGLPFKPLVISILAGTQIEQIRKVFKHRVRVIRVMPNTPAQIGVAMSAISPSDEANGHDIELAQCLFSSIGKVVTITEDLMDAFTAIAGSGPAYVFYLAEAMIDGARQLGFDAQQAQTIVRQTVLGSAMLLDQSPEMPRALREKVTSKNGTTFAATTSLDESGVMDAIVRAIHAARHRGSELGRSGA